MYFFSGQLNPGLFHSTNAIGNAFDLSQAIDIKHIEV